MNAAAARVIVYTKPACVQCNATYKVLDKWGIEYEKIDISIDAASRDFVMSLGYLQAPVVYATFEDSSEPDHFSAFRPERIKELARRLGIDVDELQTARQAS